MGRNKERLKDILKERKLTALQVSAKMRASNALVSKVMAGKEDVTESFIARWAGAAGVTIPRARRAYLRAVLAYSLRRGAWAKRALTAGGRAAISPLR